MIRFGTYFDGTSIQGPTLIKVCRLCGWQPVEAFSKDTSRKDGRRNICKACDNIHRKERHYLTINRKGGE